LPELVKAQILRRKEAGFAGKKERTSPATSSRGGGYVLQEVIGKVIDLLPGYGKRQGEKKK